MDRGKLLSLALSTPWSDPSAEPLSKSISSPGYPFLTVHALDSVEGSVASNKPSKGLPNSMPTKNQSPSPLSKKLTKKRPKSVPAMPSPKIQENDLVIHEIPLVPADMARKHARRLTMSSGMEHLDILLTLHLALTITSAQPAQVINTKSLLCSLPHRHPWRLELLEIEAAISATQYDVPYSVSGFLPEQFM